MTRVVLHVGLPKTGSTALQDHVFPAVAGIRYLGPKGIVAGDGAAAGRRLVDALTVDPRALAAGPPGAEVRRARDRILGLGGTVLLSEEGLTSNAQAYRLGYDPIPFVPAAVHALLPEATIVLVLREPAEWAGSMLWQRMFDRPLYRRHDGMNEPIGPIAYLEADLAAVRGRPTSIFATAARFDRTLAAWRAAFPPARLRVLAYERLFGPEEGWRAAFADVLGVPVAVPSPPRANATTDDRRRGIAVQFFGDDSRRIDRFVEKWRAITPAVRGHRGAMAVLRAHAQGPWEAAMAAGAGPAIAPVAPIGEDA